MVKKRKPGVGTDEISVFIRKARLLLLAEGADRFVEWEGRVRQKESEGMTRQKAVIAASKEFECLAPILAVPEVAESELNDDGRVILEDREQSHLENLRWAAAAAGRSKLTNKPPRTCPNYTAYGFFLQAMDDYKAFMATLNQAEGKTKQSEGEDEQGVAAEKLSIEEIDSILEKI